MSTTYQFNANLTAEEYARFLSESPAYTFSQLPEWANVKETWGHALCGLYADGHLVAAALLLIRHLPLGLKVIYMPRGPVVSFASEEVCLQFTAGIKKYARKIGAILVKSDPYVINENYSDQPLLDFGNSFQQTIDCMGKCGFKHKGFAKGTGAYWQPRFNMAIPLFAENGALTAESFLQKMPRKTRYYMGSFHTSKGMEFVRADSDDDLEKFVYLLKKTEERQGISLRNIHYFKTLKEAFGDRAVFYYGRIHIERYMEYLQGMIDKNENVDGNMKKLQEAKDLQQAQGDIIYLCASLVILPKPDDHLKVAEYLYAGSDLSILPTLCASTGMIYAAITDAIQYGCQYFNLGGVDGSLEDHLSKFKLKFNPHIWEFVGEFDLPIRPVFYFAFEQLLPLFKKVLHSIGNLRRGH